MTADPEIRDYLLVFRCYSGARLRPDQAILLQDIPTDSGPITVTLLTRYEDQGLDVPVPRELGFQVRRRAETLDAAVTKSAGPVTGMAAIASFVANAAVEPPRIYIAYDVTPGAEQREFVETFLPDERGLPRPGRWIDAPFFIEVIKSIGIATERPRLARAISQYDVALRYWNSGGLVLALAHLYMAAEALTKAVERQRRSELAWDHGRRARQTSWC